MQRDFLGYGDTPPAMRWPGDAGLAVSVVLNVEEGAELSIAAGDERNETVHEVVQEVKGAPDLCLASNFEYGTRIGSAPAASPEELAVKTRPTHELLMKPLPAFKAELGWRLGLALAALNFVVLGLAVASVNPRAARSTSLVFALFAFIVYYNLMTLGQSWVGAGRLGLIPFMASLHGGMLLVAAAILAARHNQWSIRNLLRRQAVQP